MPIYAYKCDACGHRKDVLQKISDPLLTDCPACGAAAFVKQVTAAGFQLKGSGWYVTDFRDGGGKKKSEGAESAADAADGAKPADKAADKPAEGAASSGPDASTGTGASKAAAPAAAAPAPSGASASAAAPASPAA